MKLRHRLERLEAEARRRPAVSPLAYPFTDDERVRGVRALLARVAIADPFPQLGGRPYLEHFRATVEEFTWRAGEVFEAIADGTLRITIGGTYPLARARDAHADLAARRTTGKLLLVP